MAAEDDPVVATFGVFLSRGKEDGATLLRFPQQPAVRASLQPVAARHRAKNDVLEVDIDVLRGLRESDKGQHFDLGTAGAHGTPAEVAEMEEKRRLQTLRSERLPRQGRSYAMGIVDGKNKRLFLVPVKSIFEMKPVLQKGFQDKSEEGEAVDEHGNVITEETPAPAEGPKRIDVVNIRKETARAAREAARVTYLKLKQREESEPWKQLRIIRRSDHAASKCFEDHKETGPNLLDASWIDGLSSGEEDGDMDVEDVEGSDDGKRKARKQAKKRAPRPDVRLLDATRAFDASAKEYLDRVAPVSRALLPGEVEQLTAGEAAAGSSNKLTLDRQILQKLARGRVLRFEDILPMAQTGTSRASRKVLEILPSVAVLVRGAWALESERFYEGEFGELCNVSGQAAGFSQLDFKRKCAARDIVLALLDQSADGSIKKDQVTKMVKMPPVTLQEALTSVAKADKSDKAAKGVFRLLCKDDPKFIKQHAKLVAQQRAAMKQRLFLALTTFQVPAAKAAKMAELPSAKPEPKQ